MSSVPKKNKNGFPDYLPTGRLAKILQEHLDKHVRLTEDPSEYGIGTLAARIGIHERRLRGILTEEFATITFETADRILIGLGKEHYWHVAKEDGGLADWYEADVLPELPPPTEKQIWNANESKRRKKDANEKRQEKRAAA